MVTHRVIFHQNHAAWLLSVFSKFYIVTQRKTLRWQWSLYSSKMTKNRRKCVCSPPLQQQQSWNGGLWINVLWFSLCAPQLQLIVVLKNKWINCGHITVSINTYFEISLELGRQRDQQYTISSTFVIQPRSCIVSQQNQLHPDCYR